MRPQAQWMMSAVGVLVPGVIPTDGLIARYNAGSVSGTDFLDQFGSYNGTHSGITVSGDLLVFNGSAYAEIPSFPTLTEWAVCYKSIFDNTTTDHTIFSNDRAGWNDDVLIGFDPETAETPDRLAAVHQDSTNSVRTIVSRLNLITSGVEYNVVIQSDGNTLYQYVDQSLSDQTARNGSALTLGGATVNIGRNPQGIRYHIGKTREILIYNRALSGAEIASI